MREFPQNHLSIHLSPILRSKRLVLSTLKPLQTTVPTRPCYRLIGGILVQRTVADVIPALETNYSGIKEVLDGLVRNYKGKEDEFEKFRGEYDIRVGSDGFF